jgi:hypothetical protein
MNVLVELEETGSSLNDEAALEIRGDENRNAEDDFPLCLQISSICYPAYISLLLLLILCNLLFL